MKTLYLDSFSGISGDMFLGLLVDLGVPLEKIETELKKLPVTGYRLDCRREKRMEIEGTKISVDCDEGHHHRTWADIDRMLEECELDAEVRSLSRRIFHRIGVAEAAIHGVPLETVHFHEVGAVDSIVDIVGAAVGLLSLGVDRIACSALPLSHGTVRCAHGTFPLPAPATLEILKGIPVTDGGCDKELVTPTGAAIAAEIAEFGAMPDMTPTRIGYGVGERVLPDRPNLLRGILGDAADDLGGERDRVAVLETHLDDANPEWLGALLEDLLEAGALDAGYSPLQMKKNRPGVKITVVAPPEKSDALSKLMMRQSSVIGVRSYETARLKLRREKGIVTTPVGEAEIKILFDGEKPVRITPEYESCRALAKASGRPLPEVYRLVERAADEFLEAGDRRQVPGARCQVTDS